MANAKPAKAKPVKYLANPVRITAKRDGFRRAGMAHSAQATTHAGGTFTEEQVRQLLAEPMLVVEILPEPPAEDGSKGGTGKTGTDTGDGKTGGTGESD